MQIKPFEFGIIETPDVTSTALPNVARRHKHDSFTQKDVERADSDGYQRGYQEGQQVGLTEGQQERFALDQQLATALESTISQLTTLVSEYQAKLKETYENVTLMAVEIARKIAGDALRDDPMPRIETMVRECVSQMMKEPKIIVNVHTSLFDIMQQKLHVISQEKGLGDAISVEENAALAPADCKIDWQDGGALLDTAHMWREIEKVVGYERPEMPEPSEIHTEKSPIEAVEEENTVEEKTPPETEATPPEEASQEDPAPE